jgi:hypothetical protein
VLPQEAVKKGNPRFLGIGFQQEHLQAMAG